MPKGLQWAATTDIPLRVNNTQARECREIKRERGRERERERESERERERDEAGWNDGEKNRSFLRANVARRHYNQSKFSVSVRRRRRHSDRRRRRTRRVRVAPLGKEAIKCR